MCLYDHSTHFEVNKKKGEFYGYFRPECSIFTSYSRIISLSKQMSFWRIVSNLSMKKVISIEPLLGGHDGIMLAQRAKGLWFDPR